MNTLRQNLLYYKKGLINENEFIRDTVAWSDARCSNKGLLTAELIKAIILEISKRYDSAINLSDIFPQFTPAYLSNLKKGKMQRITNKVILLCEILEINIGEYLIIK